MRHPRTERPRMTHPRTASRIRQLMRSGWLPDQHGSWMMALLPFLIGATRGGWHPLHAVVLAAWMVAFMLFSAGSWWIRSPKRQRFATATFTWGTLTVALGGISIICAPELLRWAPVFIPLVSVALGEALRHRQRSILARLSQVCASAFMCPVAVDIATGFERAHWFPWVGTPLWSQAWSVWALIAGLLIGSVLHVRSLIRERGNTRWVAASVIWHTGLVASASWAASGGLVHWLVPCSCAFTLTRATYMPWRHQRDTIAVKYIGLAEVAAMLTVSISLMLPA